VRKFRRGQRTHGQRCAGSGRSGPRQNRQNAPFEGGRLPRPRAPARSTGVRSDKIKSGLVSSSADGSRPFGRATCGWRRELCSSGDRIEAHDVPRRAARSPSGRITAAGTDDQRSSSCSRFVD
jgi:hypothetical protein